MDNVKNEKKIIFYDTEKRHANLKVRLQHDSLSQSAFFRMMITGYLENNAGILEYMDEYKANNNVQSKAHRKASKKNIEAGKVLENALGLGNEEVENIFDLIEQEHPEL